ncbi:putative deacetylase LmbE-like domain-containing protein [Haematococcus lacustris]
MHVLLYWGATVLAVLVAVFTRSCKLIAENCKLGPNDAILLVIAHPDDETMFFYPLISAAHAAGAQLFLLCLSTGNAYGMGSRREAELHAACKVLQVPSSHVRTVDDDRLQDGMRTSWDTAAVVTHVTAAMQQFKPTMVVTFDNLGVSHHPNHVAVHHGVRALQARSSMLGDDFQSVTWLQLESVATVPKFIGGIAVLSSCSEVWQPSGSGRRVFVATEFWRAWKAMTRHRSQLVWYRLLFMVASRYTYINTLTPLASEATEPWPSSANIVTAQPRPRVVSQ